ncbi:hypothetical protein IKF30_01575 [Candidatus Saccharibacteria bacterium]|nr:hypothetical protein [Candidatus Saccharibacteria bacterium]
MAKEVAISKRAKISQAQQYMLISVFGAAVFLGVGISLTTRFIEQIAFNIDVIAAEEESIASYSKIIKDTGICTAPKGSVYSDEELRKCDPDSIELSQIPNTLRSNILEKLASNTALNSVPDKVTENCLDQETGKNYTYKQLQTALDDAKTSTERQAATQKIMTCSALRVVPDALPAYKNEEALLASLNNIFNMSGWKPQSLSPSQDTAKVSFAKNLNSLGVSLSIEADTATTMNVLNHVERSIREFNITRASIEWSDSGLTLQARANAYYTDKSSITETETKLTAEGKKK